MVANEKALMSWLKKQCIYSYHDKDGEFGEENVIHIYVPPAEDKSDKIFLVKFSNEKWQLWNTNLDVWELPPPDATFSSTDDLKKNVIAKMGVFYPMAQV